MNTYNHHLGDYAKDTKNLSPLEHGCYRLLLDYNYATEGPIPNDVPELYRIVGAMTAAERKAVEKVAERFFPVNGDGRRHNKRAEEEIGKYLERVEHNRVVGKLGGRPRKNPSDKPQETRTDTTRVSGGKPGGNPSQEPLAIETTTSDADASEGRGAATTLPECPQKKLVALYHDALPMCPRMVEWNPGRQALMRARWLEQSKANGIRPGYRTEAEGLAWWRAYFDHVAKSRFLTGQADPRPGSSKPFVADLEWLVTPSKFAKVVEGKYHT